MKRGIVSAICGLTLLVAASPAGAELLSKRYLFKPGVILELAVSTADGMRLDTVRFELPTKVGGRIARTGGMLISEVAVSNTSEEARKTGIALALFDDEGRLLGVASGGNKLASIKPGRQKSFSLVFNGVNAEAHRATTFQVSLETK